MIELDKDQISILLSALGVYQAFLKSDGWGEGIFVEINQMKEILANYLYSKI